MTTTMQRPEAAQGLTQPRLRRTKVAVAIGALAVAVTAGALVLLVAADDSATDRDPTVAVTGEPALQDPLITRFGQNTRDDTHVQDPLIVRFGRP